jgi:hypothetical protein
MALPIATIQQALLVRDPDFPMGIATNQYVDNAVRALAELVAAARLTEPLTAEGTTVALAWRSSPVDNGSTLRIDQELGTVLNDAHSSRVVIARAVQGTTAGAHDAGALVFVAS